MEISDKKKKKNKKFYTTKYSEYMTNISDEYFCKIHNSKLKTINNLKRHLKELHSKNNYKACKFCMKEVKRLYQHYAHCKFKKFIKKKNEENIVNNTIIDNNNISKNVLSEKKDLSFVFNKDKFNLNDIFKNAADNYEKLYELISEKNKNDFLEQIQKYKVIRTDILDKGTYSICCFALDKKRKKPCAIKFSSKEEYNEDLKNESLILKELSNLDFFPKLYDFEKSGETNSYIVEDIMGPSLRKLFEFCDRKIDIKTFCNIGIDLLSCLNAIHQKGIFHMDIKLSNICWNILNNNILHPDIIFIDFGLSALEEDSNEEIYPGNYEYMEADVLEGGLLMKKHEIMNILIILLYLYKGFLPWIKKYNVNCNKRDEIIKIKKKFDFFDQVPEEIKELREIYKLVNNLEESEEIDYIEYQKILLNLKKKQKNDNDDNDFRFCWEKKILLLYQEAEQLKNPQKIKEKIYDELFKGYPKDFIEFALKKKYSSDKIDDK